MTKNETFNVAQPVLAGMTGPELEDRWLRLAVLEGRLAAKEFRAWARNLMESVSAELARRQE